MSDDVLRDLVARMATDAAFAERVRTDPAGIAAAHRLSSEQVAHLGRLVTGDGGSGPSMLDTRVSKSALFFGGDVQFEDLGLRGAADGAASALDAPLSNSPLSLGGDTHFEDLGLRDALDAHSLLGGLPAGHAAADPLGLLCDGTVAHDPAGFNCDGAQPAGIQDDTVHPIAIQCNELNPAGIQDDTVHPIAIQSNESTPVSLLTGKLVMPSAALDSAIVGPDHSAVADDPAALLCNGKSVDAAAIACNGESVDAAAIACNGQLALGDGSVKPAQ